MSENTKNIESYYASDVADPSDDERNEIATNFFAITLLVILAFV